jgi:hypothetical protein
MSYYLEGMNLIEGQELEQEQGICCGDGCENNTKDDCKDNCTWVTRGNCDWKECTDKVGNNFNTVGTDENCNMLKSDEDCKLSIKGERNGNYRQCKSIFKENSDTFSSCEDPNNNDDPICVGPDTLDLSPSDKPINTPLGKQIDDLETKFKDQQITSELMKQINKINDQTSNKLYSDKDKRYVKKISEMSLIDLGDHKNSDELDFMENIIINFLDLSDNNISDIFKETNYCDSDLNIDILLTLSIFYKRNSDNKRDNLSNIDRILNRLGRYLPDVFQKILNGMKMCPGSENKYVVLEHIYKTMFKFNETNVNLGLIDGLAKIFRYIRDMKTIEMIVVIIAIAFVISKIFDMFRVKVEV